MDSELKWEMGSCCATPIAHFAHCAHTLLQRRDTGSKLHACRTTASHPLLRWLRPMLRQCIFCRNDLAPLRSTPGFRGLALTPASPTTWTNKNSGRKDTMPRQLRLLTVAGWYAATSATREPMSCNFAGGTCHPPWLCRSNPRKQALKSRTTRPHRLAEKRPRVIHKAISLQIRRIGQGLGQRRLLKLSTEELRIRDASEAVIREQRSMEFQRSDSSGIPSCRPCPQCNRRHSHPAGTDRHHSKSESAQKCSFEERFLQVSEFLHRIGRPIPRRSCRPDSRPAIL